MRTANADVDNIGDDFARSASPKSASHFIDKATHLIQHCMDLGHNVCPINDERTRTWRPECSVKHSSIFGGVDNGAGKHGISQLGDANLLSKIDEFADDLFINQIL